LNLDFWSDPQMGFGVPGAGSHSLKEDRPRKTPPRSLLLWRGSRPRHSEESEYFGAALATLTAETCSGDRLDQIALRSQIGHWA
jgi:hypothetical protein